MILIDRVTTTVELTRSAVPPESARPAAGDPVTAAFGAVASDPAARERLRGFVLDVVRDHLRDLERRGLA